MKTPAPSTAPRQTRSALQAALQETVHTLVLQQNPMGLRTLIEAYKGTFAPADVRAAVDALAANGQGRVYRSGYCIFVEALRKGGSR